MRLFCFKSGTWKFPFKNWRVMKWLYHILTRCKNLDSLFDEFQKIGLKSDSFLIVFNFPIWDKTRCQEVEIKSQSHQNVDSRIVIFLLQKSLSLNNDFQQITEMPTDLFLRFMLTTKNDFVQSNFQRILFS